MINPAEYSVEQIQFFFLMWSRILAMLAIFPIFGSSNVPWQLKVGLSLLLSLILFPILSTRPVEIPTHLLAYAILVIKEILVGLVIGFATSLIFTGLSMAGSIIDLQIGFAMSQTIDPMSGEGSTVLGQFLLTLFTLLFLLLGGHHFLILTLVQSFDKIPILGATFLTGKLTEVMAYLITNIFVLGIKFSAPIVILLMLISVAGGVLSRTLPQMNLFVVAMPAQILVGLMGVAVMLPVLYLVFEKAYEQLQDDILKLLLLMT
jgi:flagellar biosynthetic protein FliR